jgi:hypothetical protein
MRGLIAALGAVVFIALVAAAQADVQPYATNDAGGFHDVLPPGADGLANGIQLAAFLTTGQRPPHSDDQLAMYRDLMYATPGLKPEDLGRFYKDSTFGVKPEDVETTVTPRADVTILRDKSFGIPHIYGTTRSGTMFGAGVDEEQAVLRGGVPGVIASARAVICPAPRNAYRRVRGSRNQPTGGLVRLARVHRARIDRALAGRDLVDDEVAGPREQAEDVMLVGLVARPAVVGRERRLVVPGVYDDELVGAVERLGDVVGAAAGLGTRRGGGPAQELHEFRVGHGDPMHAGDGDHGHLAQSSTPGCQGAWPQRVYDD